MNTSDPTSENAAPETATLGVSELSDGLGAVYRHFGGMCWPAAGDGLSNLQWTMRYGSAEQWRFVAASVIDAYAEMIEMPERKRNAIIKELRKGPGKEVPNAVMSGRDKRPESGAD